MRNRALSILAVLAFAALMAAPMVFSQDVSLKANIPFDFIVGARSLPAGAYALQCNHNGSPTVVLRGVDVKAAIVAMTTPTRGLGIPREGKLVFHRYGDSYFLAEVWRPGYVTGNAVPTSKAEREMAAKAAQGATTELALISAPKTK